MPRKRKWKKKKIRYFCVRRHDGKLMKARSIQKLADMCGLSYWSIVALTLGRRVALNGYFSLHPSIKELSKKKLSNYNDIIINTLTLEKVKIGKSRIKISAELGLHHDEANNMIRRKSVATQYWMHYDTYKIAFPQDDFNGLNSVEAVTNSKPLKLSPD